MRTNAFYLVLLVAACDGSSPTVTDGGDDSGAADLLPGGDLSHSGDLSQPQPPDLAPLPAPADAGPADAGLCVASQACAVCGDHRQCAVSADCQPTCGACDDQYEPIMGSCQPSEAMGACGQSGDCPGQYCLQLDVGDDPRCRPAPCPAGQSWDRVGQRCIFCHCGDGGTEWPVTDANGGCYCGAGEGEFYDRAAGGAIKKCDADGDGWLNKEVGDELQWATGSQPFDYTVIVNVGCVLRGFTEVDLVNEWGQEQSISLHDLAPDWVAAGASMVPMYESPGNDDGTNEALGKTGLGAADANPLLKACASPSLDLNQNGLPDVDESQSDTPNDAWLTAYPYQPLTGFAPLYHVQHLPSPSPTSQAVVACPGCLAVTLPVRPGVLRIVEQSRCRDFPLQYSDGSSYWSGCTRYRDAGFRSIDELGYDYAAWDCGGSSGACPLPAPPIALPSGEVPPHGLCDPGVAAGSAWRGMTDYSQFLCAHIVEQKSGAKNEATLADLATEWEPLSSPSPSPGDVTWLGRRYQSYTAGHYSAGCIDEAVEWPQLCPENGNLDIGDPDAFGRIICGPPCPGSDVFYGSFWICAHPVASRGGSWANGTWSLSGAFDPGGANHAPLTSDCTSGGICSSFTIE